MSKIQETGKVIETQVTSFLSGKPIWMWWIGFIVLTGFFFAVFYLIFYVLTVKWWVAVIIILAIGFVWGTINYIGSNPDKK